MKVTQGWRPWVRRMSFAAVLLVAAITPGMASGWSSRPCQRSARWTRGYSATTGRELWHYPRALPDTVDAVAGRLYLISGNTLIGVNPQTGNTLARVSAASSSGLYGVREGAVLGIDHGALGKAWGYGIGAQQVIWTSRPLPWPHYFVDLSGIGGSAPPGQDAVLLAICGQVASQAAGATVPRCTRPELAVLNR